VLNEVLKYKFRKVHTAIVNNVDPGNIINFLFGEEVITGEDMRTLLTRPTPQQKCSELLSLLHTSENPQAFIQLNAAIKKEPYLQWLIERLHSIDRQFLSSRLQQIRISDTTGERMFMLCNRMIRISNDMIV